MQPSKAASLCYKHLSKEDVKMKLKSVNPKFLIPIFLLAGALFLAAGFFGLFSTRSAMRVGYIGHESLHSWSGRYALLDGTMKHTIRPKDSQTVLHIETVTESGTISVEVKDAQGNILFQKDHMQTGSFEIAAPGKVTVSIKGDHHKGSFAICFAEASPAKESSAGFRQQKTPRLSSERFLF